MQPDKFIANCSAIYGLRNLTNGKLYVGKTHCMYRRCAQYLYDVEHERLGHINRYLLSAILKVGIANFEMFVLEFCEPDELSQLELKWITKLNTTDRAVGYNLRIDSSSGMLAHADSRLRMSENLKRQWASGIRDGHSEKMKKSWANATSLRIETQREQFRKIRTKFEYVIEYADGTKETCTYLRLKELGLQRAVGNMWRSNKTSTKLHCGLKIGRHLIEAVK